MTGAEWLQQVFERGLETDDPTTYPALRGALHGLSACGVLTQEQARAAERRLNTFVWAAPAPRGSAWPDVRAPATTASAPCDELETVLAPARSLADVDGITVLLVSLEMWTSWVSVRLAGLPSELTDELEAGFQNKLEEWAAQTKQAREAGSKEPRLADQPGNRLMQMPLSLEDDLGTLYQAHHRSAGGTGTEWRSEWRFEPGVPREATRLNVTLQGSDGRRHVQELPLPDPR